MMTTNLSVLPCFITGTSTKLLILLFKFVVFQNWKKYMLKPVATQN